MALKLMLVLSLVGLSSAWLWRDNPDWDGLKVTFGFNPFSSTTFDSQPRLEAEAVSDGWTKIADCDAAGQFRGVRYVKDNDYSVVLLFDVNGYIAGIQCALRKDSLRDDYPPVKQRGYIFQDDGDYYTLTAYFTDPETICSSGRTHSDFSDDGTGSGLFIQNGSDPVTQSISIPSSQSEMETTDWKLGHCFYGMGVHYWYDVAADMRCEDFQPVFLMYNDGKLNAFGWATGSDQSSERFEHPPARVISTFINPMPTCLKSYPELSTMHVYMTNTPRLNWC